jgi:chromate transporter
MNSVLPELHRTVIDVRGWMDERSFTELYALGYALPGPNILVLTLTAAYVGGPLGALVATASAILPCMLITGAITPFWHRFRDSRWRRWMQSGLLAVTAGLTLAGGYVLTQAAAHHWGGYVLTAATVALLHWTRFNPLWLIGLGAALGYAEII